MNNPAVSIFKFYGYQTPLCLLRFSNFTIQEIKFTSLQHFLNVRKAIFFEDFTALGQFLALDEMQSRSIQVANFDKDSWESVAPAMLWEALVANVSLIFNFFT